MPTMRRHRVIDNLGLSSLGFRGLRFRGAKDLGFNIFVPFGG